MLSLTLWSLIKRYCKVIILSLYIIAEIMAENRNPRWRLTAVRQLGFSKTWFLTNESPWAADFPSGYQIWCKNVDRRRNYGPKWKSNTAAVRHLGIVVSSYRTTHEEVFSFGHIRLSNFMQIRCIFLKICQFEFFADLAWNAYSRPQNFGFWDLNS